MCLPRPSPSLRHRTLSLVSSLFWGQAEVHFSAFGMAYLKVWYSGVYDAAMYQYEADIPARATDRIKCKRVCEGDDESASSSVSQNS
jgi:hypothetical protein